MKRLYLVGTTADSKRLVLAKAQGAKFGSFVVPITPKLRKIFNELEAGRVENVRGGGKPAAAAEPEAAAEMPAGPTNATASEGDRSGSFERMTGLSRRGGSAARGSAAEGRGRGRETPQAAAAAAAAAAAGRRARPSQAPEAEPEPEPARPVERRPPINSKLAPAQIQAMLRQGKSARSVAAAAGAPIEWVQRLMEPILLERMGIVEEMKRATFTKARLGPSLENVGRSIIDNLRDRGVPFPERVSADGWSAHRPDGREWRVRFTYAHRGSARTAQWRYDPPTRSVVPVNTLAAQLSWRPGPNAENGDGPARKAVARKAPKRTPGRKPAARKAPAKKTTRKPAAKAATARARGRS